MDRNKILIFCVASLSLSCSDKWHQTASPSLSVPITLHTHRQTEFDDCFLDSIPAITTGITAEFSQSCPITPPLIPLEVRLIDTSFAAGYYLPRIGHSVIGIIATERQHAVFAHEYVRHLCYVTGCCPYDHPSSDWSGSIGNLWQHAESLAYKLCG